MPSCRLAVKLLCHDDVMNMTIVTVLLIMKNPRTFSILSGSTVYSSSWIRYHRILTDKNPIPTGGFVLTPKVTWKCSFFFQAFNPLSTHGGADQCVLTKLTQNSSIQVKLYSEPRTYMDSTYPVYFLSLVE